MYTLIVFKLGEFTFDSFIRGIRAGKYFQSKNYNADLLLNGKKDQIRISWSTSKSLIGNHGFSYGHGDCKVSYMKFAKKCGLVS